MSPNSSPHSHFVVYTKNYFSMENFTQKKLLEFIPPKITYSTNYNYDIFNHGKSKRPTTGYLWEDFTNNVEAFQFKDTEKIYERSTEISLSNTPIEKKADLVRTFESQIIKVLETVFNTRFDHHDTNLKFKRSESYINSNLIDWKITCGDSNEKVIAVLALKSK